MAYATIIKARAANSNTSRSRPSGSATNGAAMKHATAYVPKHTPHALANRSGKPVTMFFQSSVKKGHEEYFEELSALPRRTNSRPSERDMKDLRERYDTEQTTPLHDH